jgi:hypothetical protein
VESSPDYILHILKTFNTFAQIETEYMVAAVIYMERILKSSNDKLRICARNWHRILWSCMVLASKVWDDFAMSNSDYSQIFPNMSLAILNQMECEILTLFNYDVQLKTEEYVFYNNTFIAMILEAKLKSSISMLNQQQQQRLSSSHPSPLPSTIPSETTLKPTRTLFVPSEMSHRTEGVYSSNSTSSDHELGEDESVDEDDGEISPLAPHLARQFSRQLSSSRFRYGCHLSPVISEFVSHSHSQSFTLTPHDDVKFQSSFSSCPSGASISSLPLGRKRLFSEEILKLRDLDDEDTLSGKKESPLKNAPHLHGTANEDDEVKEKKRIFQLLLQIRKNKIQPAPLSPVAPSNLTLPNPHQPLPLKQSFLFKPSQLFSKLSFREILTSSSSNSPPPMRSFPRHLHHKFFHNKVHLDGEMSG